MLLVAMPCRCTYTLVLHSTYTDTIHTINRIAALRLLLFICSDIDMEERRRKWNERGKKLLIFYQFLRFSFSSFNDPSLPFAPFH
jgi:hypothetical protein